MTASDPGAGGAVPPPEPVPPDGVVPFPGGGRSGPGRPRKIIPLLPGVARPRGERRVAMQQAVVEVIGHLVLEAVPPQRRSPLFNQARDLLGEAGWGLDELFEAVQDGPARRELFRTIGLET